MARSRPAIFAFNRGRVSPLAHGRIDLERLAISAEIQKNWMPRSLGPMALRPGLEYLLGTPNDAANTARFFPFIFATDDVALIEMSDESVRIIVDDEVVGFDAVDTLVDDLDDWTDADDPGAVSGTEAEVPPGGAEEEVSITDQDISDIGASPTARAEYRLNSNGDAEYREYVVLGTQWNTIASEWLNDGFAANYEVRFTVTAGALSSGTEDTWLNLSTTRTISCVGVAAATVTVEIRLASTQVVADTATVTLEAEDLV